ncbi:MAG: hypothetical protein KIT46_09980 [Anaerolineales bacterium]|nr:hypothetical protein [Anaerolineales bacterium]MCW5856359.1 hypothetical protein [Anaerolineales bacterium]
MRLTPPTKVVFWISAILTVVALLGALGVVAALAPYAAWLAIAGAAILLAGNALKGF